MDYNKIIQELDAFRGSNVQDRLNSLTGSYAQQSKNSLPNTQEVQDYIQPTFLQNAIAIKKASARIDDIIQTIGTLELLPHILDEDEIIYNLKTGSNTKDYNIITNKRVVVTKFIHWSDGGNSARYKGLFKILFNMIVDNQHNDRKKEIYVIGDVAIDYFTNSNSEITETYLGNANNRSYFKNHFSQYSTVSRFYNAHKHMVKIIDMKKYLSYL